MESVLASTCAVVDALNDLHDVVQEKWDDRSRSRVVLAADCSEDHIALFQAYKKLEQSLVEAGEVIHNPVPGQGLASIWLKEVCQKTESVEKRTGGHADGWKAVILHDDSNLRWLVWDGWQMGYNVFKWSRRNRSRLLSLLEPEVTPLVELRQLAQQWSVDFNDSLPEPRGFVQQGALRDWLPWQQKRDAYVRQAGELILRAVAELEVRPDLFRDEQFRGQVLKYLDLPSGLAWSRLSETSGAGLLALVEWLSPQLRIRSDAIQSQYEQEYTGQRQNESVDEAPQQGSALGTSPRKAYSTPELYPRDKWIYENIHLHDCQTLSKMLEKECHLKQWKFIDSRNGFKESADRYASFHGYPQRRFPDPRTPN
jgi:hypothetical protein